MATTASPAAYLKPTDDGFEMSTVHIPSGPDHYYGRVEGTGTLITVAAAESGLPLLVLAGLSADGWLCRRRSSSRDR